VVRVLTYHDEVCEFGGHETQNFSIEIYLLYKCKLSDNLISIQNYGRITLKSEWYTKICSTAYSYPDDNSKSQDYVRHFSGNVVHPEDNFLSISK